MPRVPVMRRSSGSKSGPAPMTMLLLLLLGTVMMHAVGTVTEATGSLKEFCQWEDFTANCSRSEVILIQSALLGRMNLGRCIKRDYDYLGCAIDVSSYVDYKCSGQRACRFPVFDEFMRQVKPCPEDFLLHLKASYTCLTVHTAHSRDCRMNHELQLSGTSGYIASVETRDHGFGDASCPWVIEVNDGQKVNLTLFNFARGGQFSSGGRQAHGSQAVCYEVAGIREPSGATKTVTLCDGSARESSIYISTGNKVTIQFESSMTLEELGAFVIKYEAVGCPDLQAPDGGVIQREGNDVTVRCRSSGHTRYLTCKGTNWIGTVGNCSTGYTTNNPLFSNNGVFPYGILLVVAIGVALGVFCGGLLLSAMVLYMRRKHRHSEPPQEMEPRYSDDKYTTFDPRMAKRASSTTTTDAGLITPSSGVAEGYFPRDPEGAVKAHVHLPPGYGQGNTLPRVHREMGHGYDHRHIYECPKFL